MTKVCPSAATPPSVGQSAYPCLLAALCTLRLCPASGSAAASGSEQNVRSASCPGWIRCQQRGVELALR